MKLNHPKPENLARNLGRLLVKRLEHSRLEFEMAFNAQKINRPIADLGQRECLKVRLKILAPDNPVIHNQKFETITICHPIDKFDFVEGFKVGAQRLTDEFGERVMELIIKTMWPHYEVARCIAEGVDEVEITDMGWYDLDKIVKFTYLCLTYNNNYDLAYELVASGKFDEDTERRWNYDSAI